MSRNFWLAGLLLALLWLVPLGAHSLLDPDEGRYAEIPRAMVATGDWVTPRLNGLKYFEKPALQYWATAVSYEVFGVSEWSARLVAALCALAGMWLVFWSGRRLFDVRTGTWAALLLAGSLLYAGSGRFLTLDMSLCFGLQLCLTGLLLLVRRDAVRSDARFGAALLALGVVIALLVKGLIGVLIPVAVAGLFMLLWRDWDLLLRSRPWWTLLALGVLAAPWFIVVSLRNPEFAHFFFIHEHFERYLTTVHQRYEPDWFFIPVLLAGFLPFTTLLWGGLSRGWRDARAGSREASLLLIWVGFIFLFFSLSQSKLIAYVLPAWPALALLVARAMPAMSRTFVRHVAAAALVAIALLLALLAIRLLPFGAGLLARSSPAATAWMLAAAALWAAGGVLAWWFAARARITAALVSLTVAAMLFAQLLLQGATFLPGRWGIREMARVVTPQLAADTPVFCVTDYLQTINFYLRRNCTLVRYRGELAFGAGLQPDAWIADEAGFVERWKSESQALALMPANVYGRLSKQEVPMRVLFSSPIIVAVMRQ